MEPIKPDLIRFFRALDYDLIMKFIPEKGMMWVGYEYCRTSESDITNCSYTLNTKLDEAYWERITEEEYNLWTKVN